MSSNTLKTRIRHAYKTEAEWTSSNPVLLEGEVGYVENGRFKVGDGTSTWSELPYAIPVTKSDIGLGNVGNFKAVSTVASQGLSDSEKSNARTNISAAASFHSHSEYVNQNTFSNVVVGETTIAADSITDTLTLVAGSNVTLTPDVTNNKITITTKDTVYTHPITAGNKHIPSGGTTGQVLKWSSDGDAEWDDDSEAISNNEVDSLFGGIEDGEIPPEEIIALSPITSAEVDTIFSQMFSET